MSNLQKKCCIIYTTTDNIENAERIANNLLQQKLAACIQVDEVYSFFVFEGKNRKAKEFRLTIKAQSSNYKQIEKLVKNEHDYELPQIVKIDIDDGLPAYVDWVLNG